MAENWTLLGFYSYFLHSVIYLFMKFGFYKWVKIMTIFIFHVLIKFANSSFHANRGTETFDVLVYKQSACVIL